MLVSIVSKCYFPEGCWEKGVQTESVAAREGTVQGLYLSRRGINAQENCGTPDGHRHRSRASRSSLDRQRLAVGDQVHREAHGGSGSPEAGGRPRRCDRHVQRNADGHKLTWTLTFSHLSGAALAAHIHLGKKGVAGNVLVPLCPTATSAACKSPLKGTATLKASQIKSLNAGGLYVNVHTKKNAGGEIRGQIGM